MWPIFFHYSEIYIKFQSLEKAFDGFSDVIPSKCSSPSTIMNSSHSTTSTPFHRSIPLSVLSHLCFNTSASTRTTSLTLPHPNILILLIHFPRPSPHASQPPHSLSSSGSRKMTTSKVALQNILTLACHPLQNRVHHSRLNTSTNTRTTLPILPHLNVLIPLARSPRPFPRTS